MAAFLDLGLAQAAPYLAYYRKKYGASTSISPSPAGATYSWENNPTASIAAYQSALVTGKRRSMLADEQGYGAKGDLTDAVVQDAATRERRRRTVGVNRVASFLSPAKSLLAGGL